jgi:hypothetical protein
MVSSGMLRRVVLVRTDVSEELSSFIIRVTINAELGTTLTLVFLLSMRRILVTVNVMPSPQNIVTMVLGALTSSETSDLTRTTRHNNPEDGILHSQRSGNLKSC